MDSNTRRRVLAIGLLVLFAAIAFGMTLVVADWEWRGVVPVLWGQIAASAIGSILVCVSARQGLTRILAGGFLLFSVTCSGLWLYPEPYQEEAAGYRLGILMTFLLMPATALLCISTLVATLVELRGSSARPGFCAKCGYNLTGLTEPRCPECGTPFDAKVAAGRR